MRIGYVSLNVPDLQKSLDFYQSILGFKAAGRPSSEKALLSTGGGPYLVELLQVKGNDAKADVRVPKRAGLNHFGVELPASEFENTVAHLTSRDIVVKESGHLQDPDGITIRLSRAPQ